MKEYSTKQVKKDVRDLLLNEYVFIEGNMRVLKVPGGWIYFETHNEYNKRDTHTSTFVPEPNPLEINYEEIAKEILNAKIK